MKNGEKSRVWIWVILWLSLFLFAIAVDRPVEKWAYASGLAPAMKSNWHWLAKTIRVAGNFFTFTLPAAAILFLLERKRWQLATFILVCGALSIMAPILKWVVGRPRPFRDNVFQVQPFTGGLHGLLHEVNLSFPSGDVCLAATTAGGLVLLFPRWKAAGVAVIILVALERMAEGSHYPSDVVAGAILGLALSRWAWNLFGRPRWREIGRGMVVHER